MKVKSKLWMPLLLAVAMACSDDSDEKDVAKCSELPTGMALEKAWGFTGTPIRITGTFSCLEGITEARFNGKPIELGNMVSSSIFVILPSGMGGKGKLEIVVGDEVVEVPQELTVYPGNGTWKEIASFPGETRGWSQTFTANGKAYVLGGKRPLNLRDDKMYNDVYQYDITANQWSFVAEDAAVTGGFELGFCDNSKFYVYGNDAGHRVLDLTTKSFSAAEKQQPIGRGFYLNNTFYQTAEYSYALNTPGIGVLRNLTGNEKDKEVLAWTAGKTKSPRVVLSMTYKGKGYYGIVDGDINKDLKIAFMEFDPATNTIQEKSQFSFGAGMDQVFNARYLFTIDNQAYFAAGASTSLSEQSSDVGNTANSLLVYNFEVNDWTVSEPQQPLMNHVGFGIDNRGFVGMGVVDKNVQDPLYEYDSKFYEFIPE